MNQRVMFFSAILCGLICAVSVYAYRVFKAGTDTNQKPSYYVQKGQKAEKAVYLDLQDLAKLDSALRNFLDTEQEFNQRIDDSLIKKVKAACQSDESCDLIDRVLGDFKGKKLSDLFLTLGLRTDI